MTTTEMVILIFAVASAITSIITAIFAGIVSLRQIPETGRSINDIKEAFGIKKELSAKSDDPTEE